jgi:hypothetical protein
VYRNTCQCVPPTARRPRAPELAAIAVSPGAALARPASRPGRRTVQGMADHTDPQITLRTTSDGAGQPLGIVTGTGTSPEQALRDLAARAPEVARAAWRAPGSRPRRREPGDPPSQPQPVQLRIGPRGQAQDEAEFAAAQFEVVDVRLVAGNPDTDAWAAIGTLCQVTERNYWDEPGR